MTSLDGPPAACPADTSGPMPLSAITAHPAPAGIYQTLREQHGPVVRVELEPGVNGWLVMGWEQLVEMNRDEKRFSRDARQWRDFQTGVVPSYSGLGPMMFWRANVIGADRSEHRRLRRPLDSAVDAVDQRSLRRFIQDTCTELIGQFAARGHADLLTEYAIMTPLLAHAHAFGLDPGRGQELLLALFALFGSGDDSQDGSQHFTDMLSEHATRPGAATAEDLTAVLLQDPLLRSHDEIVQSMVVMISAGQETTTIWIAQSLRRMLTDPRFAARMRGGRLGVDEALDEVLWRDPPMTHMPARYALEDTELGGQRIARGDALILGLAAAGYDPKVHPGDPHSAVELGNRAHLAFSAGPHRCPAENLARLITRTAVETAFHRLPDLALAVPADDIVLRPSPWTRCPASLPVTFTPAPAATPAAPHPMETT